MLTSTQTLAIILTASVCTFLLRVRPLPYSQAEKFPPLSSIWAKCFQLRLWHYWWYTA